MTDSVLSAADRAILDCLCPQHVDPAKRADFGASLADIAKDVQRPRGTVKNRLEALQAAGVVECNPAGPLWVLVRGKP